MWSAFEPVAKICLLTHIDPLRLPDITLSRVASSIEVIDPGSSGL